MSLATAAQALREFHKRFEIDANHRRGREFIPTPRVWLSIETSSICNLECRFCAYVKKQSPKVSMPNDLFFDCIEQALEMGMRSYQLTPCTGDVFMDRQLFTKLDFLEQHPQVSVYTFFTNFTIPSREDVERLIRLEKLGKLTLSVYGHDLASFMAITGSTEKVYKRLVANMETVLDQLDRCRPSLEIGLRTTKHVPRGAPSDLLKLLRRFKRAGIRVRTSRVYDNWGGYITQEDVQGLGIDIGAPDSVYKKGACSLLFTYVQVMATGIVNGCACRDVDATLRIGDLHEAPLKTILSTENPAYMELIREQQSGHFRPVCRSCDFYKSIYHMRSIYRKNKTQLQTLEQFMAGSAEQGATHGLAQAQQP